MARDCANWVSVFLLLVTVADVVVGRSAAEPVVRRSHRRQRKASARVTRAWALGRFVGDRRRRPRSGGRSLEMRIQRVSALSTVRHGTSKA